jgi:chromosome partitioning protein
MARVITFGNHKGGVGKTTMTVTVGAGLAILGKRVLIIDTDAQGNAALAFGMEREYGLYDLLVRKAPWVDVLRNVPYTAWAEPGGVDDGKGKLMLLPSNHETRHIPGTISDPFALLRRVAEISPHFDFILVDTAPTPSMLHSAVYAATQDFVYVTLPEMWSLSGLADTLEIVKEYNPFRESKKMPPIRLAAIQPVRVRLRTIEHEENIAEIRHHFGTDVVAPPMRDLIAWSESASRRKSIFAYAPDSEAAADAWAAIENIQGVLYAK